jgi:hypothetical protein
MKEQLPYYKFHFNKVFVMESMPLDEHRTGMHLHDDTIRPRTWQHSVLKSEYIYISNSVELFSTLDYIEQQIIELQQLPYLHFEMHGSRIGVHLQQDVVTWNELTNRLRRINILARNNLMISFATCFGNEIHKLIDFAERAPFFGFIAPIATVSTKTIEVGFNAFFTKLFTGEGLGSAYEALNDTCINNEYFVLDNCEDTFTRPLKKQITDLQNPSYYTMYVLERANEMLSFPGIRRLHSLPELIQLAKMLIDEIISLTRDLNFFLMRDLPQHTITSQKI